MGIQYSYNRLCLLRDGQPWFPVMGEIHYSRYREGLWEESLRKMKAGGVSIVSAYAIWIHHEEEKGSFDFTGCRNLRGFLEACKKVGVCVFLRLGPWVHGEVRNGGFPDWLVREGEQGVLLRSNDDVYLGYVRRYWERLFEQAKGMMHEDGGPIIGIQIENEYGHVGGLRGEAGEAHIRALTALAKEIGFRAPYYTATGWGGACIGDLLPVMGGYCEAPWDQRITELEPNANFVFSYLRNDKLIASDHHVENNLTFDASRYPFLTAELGGGLQVTSHRRPVATGRDIGAMSLVKLGNGASLLGYYMYHGGSNPKGKLSTLQESRATGYTNDLPEINYDFNAPIRQYGTISDSYREVRLLAYFLEDFGAELAEMETDIVPPAVRPEDFHTLRISCRHNAERGYVFYNNYQRRYRMEDHRNVMLSGICDGENVEFGPIDIPDGDFGFFPYRMKLGDACLRSALATPLCRLRTKEGDTWVFYGDREPDFVWEKEQRADILTLSRSEALLAGRIRLDQDYLVLAEDFVWEEDGAVRVTGQKDTRIRSFPALPQKSLPGFSECGHEGRFTVYERHLEEQKTETQVTLLSRDAEKAVYEISILSREKKDRLAGRDTLLWLTYSGDRMEIFAGGEKINDHFYTGQKVPLGLGYFDFPDRLQVVVYALREGAPVFLEQWPAMENGAACGLEKVEVTEQYR